MSDAPVTYRVVLNGGPCDGMEQNAANPPPLPEYVVPWKGTRDAIYRIERESGLEFVFQFVEFRERKET